MNGLHACRIVDVRNGRKRGAFELQLVDPGHLSLFVRQDDPQLRSDRSDNRHIRAWPVLLEVVGYPFGKHRWCKWSKRFPVLDLQIHHRLHVSTAWVTEDRPPAESAGPELHPA